MKALKETSMKTGRDVVSIFLFLMLATQTLAANIVDSDLSNNAGTNKNWQNGFWFLMCTFFIMDKEGTLRKSAGNILMFLVSEKADFAALTEGIYRPCREHREPIYLAYN